MAISLGEAAGPQAFGGEVPPEFQMIPAAAVAPVASIVSSAPPPGFEIIPTIVRPDFLQPGLEREIGTINPPLAIPPIEGPSGESLSVGTYYSAPLTAEQQITAGERAQTVFYQGTLGLPAKPAVGSIIYIGGIPITVT